MRRRKRFEKAAFESVSIAVEVRKRLNTYEFSPVVMKILKLKKGWQEAIPDILMNIIVEQTLLIHRENERKPNGINLRLVN